MFIKIVFKHQWILHKHDSWIPSADYLLQLIAHHFTKPFSVSGPFLNGNRRSGWPQKPCQVMNHVKRFFSCLSAGWNIDFNSSQRSAVKLPLSAREPRIQPSISDTYWEISLNVLKWNAESLLIYFSAFGQAVKWMACTNWLWTSCCWTAEKWRSSRWPSPPS